MGIQVFDPKYVGQELENEQAGYFSGLKKIVCTITAEDIAAKETITILDLKKDTDVSALTEKGFVVNEDGLIESWKGTITVSAGTFNSNNITVTVTALDNAGNERVSKNNSVHIDTTAPEIDIIYVNNEADNGNYFKNDRTAVIKITERNFTASDVKISITNSDGTIPSVSDWSRTNGSGNGDNTVWTATIDFTADGDYAFGINYADDAGNTCKGVHFADGTVAPTLFTIDKTAPQVEVRYDNNASRNGMYYNADRTATVVVKEHNFQQDRVEITLSATNDGAAATVPAVSGWTSDGDTHYATIRYTNDAKYTFDVAVKDKAGNASADFAEQTFVVDKTAPTLHITGVEDKSANNASVMPVVTYSDTNYDKEAVSIVLKGANRGIVALDGTYGSIHNGQVFSFKDFVNRKEVDDIYTLTATLTDLAGNTSTEEITFSVNRFGSTYVFPKETAEINGTYVKEPQDIVVTEVNANALKNRKITLFKNNETITLEEGKDYSVDVKGGNGEWYEYTYTIFKENFMDDGVYRITIYSEDMAENVAENTLDTKEAGISFGVDKTNPTILVENIESGMTYAVEGMTVTMSIQDNLLLSKVSVYLDNYTSPYKTWSAEEIADILSGNGTFSFDIPGDVTSSHDVKIVAVDASGNEQTEEVNSFFVTTNLLVRYVNNKPVFYGSIGGMILLIGLTLFIILRKKDEDAEEA